MKLPKLKPDKYGHYWLKVDDINGPVIFKAGDPSIAPKQAKGYFASCGGTVGVIFDGPNIRYFGTPEEAYKAMVKVGEK